MNLSIVMAGRNDGHCGDFIARMNKSLATLPDAEIIMVEWNPPEDTAPLSTLISRKGVRVITVPRDIHNSMHGNEVLPFFEYRAKNVGIRRAHSDFILSMNTDILLSPEMHDRLRQPFELFQFYQTNRHDLGPTNELLQVCVGPGDFMLMSRSLWESLGGYLDLVSYSHLDSLLCWNAEHFDFKRVNLEIPIYHQEHDRSIHKTRMTIHSSDIPRFIGQRNGEDWGLRDVQLPETVT